MVKYLLHKKKQMETPLTKYLDDFLFAALAEAICDLMLNMFIEMCKKLGVPISVEKTEWSTQLIVFLGVLLDGCFQLLSVPEDKRIRALHMLKACIDKKKATVKDLQSLAGLLNFLNRAIVPGRAFTCHMYAKCSGFYEQKPGNENSRNKKLLQHHHVRLDAEFKADCAMWCRFLESTNHGIQRPFVDLNKSLEADILDLYTDAAKGKRLGVGGVYGRRWFFAQ